MQKSNNVNKLFVAVACTALSVAGTISKTEALGSHRVFNVKTYGATGNGTTDDTAAIQAAITAAGDNTGNQVYFPSGTYALSSHLAISGITLTGSGATLLSVGTDGCVQIVGSQSTVSNLAFQAVSGNAPSAFIQSFNNTSVSITGNTFGANTFYCFLAGYDSSDLIQGNSFTGSGNSFPLDVEHSTNSVIASNTFTATGSTTLNSIRNISDSGMIVRDNKFNLQTNDGVFSYAYYESFGVNNQIINNTVYGGGWGLTIDTSNGAVVANNQIQNTHISGVLVSNAVNTTVQRNSIAHSVVGVAVESASSSTVVSNNIVSDCANWGVYASRGGNISVTGNQLTSCGLSLTSPPAVIYVNQPKASAITITGNQYKGNTSGLLYFIDVVQTAGVQVSGNKTNTLLTTKVGP